MTTTTPTTTADQLGSSRAGAVGALTAAATFVFGIALFVTSLSDYIDATAAESVDFLVSHQTTLFAWYFVIFLVFGVAIIPLARALHRRLADVSPQLADIGAVFAYIWAGLMFATGMISNVGITAVADWRRPTRQQRRRCGRASTPSPRVSEAATSWSVGCGFCW
jgi:hypothetical protein